MPFYDDEYPTCSETYATLRFYHEQGSPEVVTETLQIGPTTHQTVGNLRKGGSKVRLSGWFLCSKGELESNDARRHVDWILNRVKGLENEVRALQSDGWRADIICFWLSVGHGGPILDPTQMEKLSRFELSCGFDVYFDRDNSATKADRVGGKIEEV